MDEEPFDKLPRTYDDNEEFLLTKFVSLEPEELVLSDVHLFANNTSPDVEVQHDTAVSRFVFSDSDDRDSGNHEADPKQVFPVVDSDGDYILYHRINPHQVLLIEHRMATELINVGAQVWRGALYLGDFVLSNKERFQNQVIVELGAGVGLVAVLLCYIGSKTIFATDCSDIAMEICDRNKTLNAGLRFDNSKDVIRTRRLDWRNRTFRKKGPDDGDVFSWGQEDITLLESGFIVVAADVIYSDECTDAFFETLTWLSDEFKTSLSVYISLEKRLNFTIDDLEVCSPPYRNFLRNIEKHKSGIYPRICCTRVEFLWEQHFSYDRVDELELWHCQVFGPKI